MEYNQNPAPYLTSDQNSHAYTAVREEWPLTLVKIINDVQSGLRQIKDTAKESEGRSIIKSLTHLKYELQYNAPINLIADNGNPLNSDYNDKKSDIASYNDKLSALNFPTWFKAPALFAEFYLYCRISIIFAHTNHWKSYDPYMAQKLSMIRFSRLSVCELAATYCMICFFLSQLDEYPQPDRTELLELILTDALKISLWHNAVNLSPHTADYLTKHYENWDPPAWKSNDESILINDLSKAYTALSTAKLSGKQTRTVDIVLDNAGVGLYVDLMLATSFLAAGLATKVILHVKCMPFGSAASEADFTALLSVLKFPQDFFNDPQSENEPPQEPRLPGISIGDITQLYFYFSKLYDSGQLIFQSHPFWTSAHSFRRIPSSAPDLYSAFQKSELVIIKGDLNYRKLVGDRMWDPTTPFEEALGPMGEGSGVRILAVRRCESDVIVGLGEGVDEKLKGEQHEDDREKRMWAWSGKWAVVQFCDG